MSSDENVTTGAGFSKSEARAPGEALLPYLIAQRFGFYREEGFDVDVIVTRGTVTTQGDSFGTTGP